MANRHFGKLADVWKHLVLAEVLDAERPARFYDTHAGNAKYAVTTDAERRYGVLGLLDLVPQHSDLATSRYVRLLRRHVPPGGALTEYPAGPMIAMLELGESCDYLFCDLDHDSTASIGQAAARLGLESRVRVVDGDGMTAVGDALSGSPDQRRSLVFVDPFEQHTVGPGGLSAVGLSRRAADLGAAVVHWYGYDHAEQRNWLYDDLRDTSPSTGWWCGDIMITRVGADLSVGDLGVATSPGTGFGLVCANVPTRALLRCTELGAALGRAYEGRPLPDGQPGDLSFSTMEHDGVQSAP